MAAAIGGLGEIALRVNDIPTMRAFYRDVIGLEVIGDFGEDAMTFFKIADGFAGHTQILALFSHDRARNTGNILPARVEQENSSLHHIAFAIDRNDFAAEKARIEATGCDVRTSEHGWVQWRSFYISDPEGNTVEWVCYDESIPKTV